MASLSNINGLFDVHSTGAILFSTSHGLTGQILRSNGNAAPTWIDFSSTGFGGDYLPLVGGVLEGNLTINGTYNLTVGGTVGITGLLTGTTGSFSGLVSGITPTAAANFATKDYVDNNAGTTYTAGNGITLTGTPATVINADINYISYSGSNNFIVYGAQDGLGTTIPTGSIISYVPSGGTQIVTKAYVSDLPFTNNTGGPFLPLAGGALTGATSITVGTNTTTFSTTANQLIIKNSYHASASGLALRSSNDTHCMQLYGEAAAYGFLASEWGAWNIRKVVSGGLYLNNNTTYFVQPEGTSNMNAVTFAGNVAAPTFNGLPIETSQTNNNVNKIVRTTVNGYVNFGWINSTSGATTSTITRITASDDAYLRYVTPATFRTQITDPYYAPTGTVSGVTSVATSNGITGGTITTTGTVSLTGTYTGRWNGTTGYYIKDTRAGDITPADSTDHAMNLGFTNQVPGNGNWQSYIQMKGWSDGYTSWQIIGPSTTTAYENWYLRAGLGASWGTARQIWHTGNLPSGSGVTSVATGSGLTGGTITTTGTLSVDTTVIRTTGNQSMSGIKSFTGAIATSGAQTRNKISVWSNATEYTIGMRSSYTFGGLSNEYAMSFQMNNSNGRGFWWGDTGHTQAQGAMSLTTQGVLAVAGSLKLGFGESDTTAAAYTLQANGTVYSANGNTAAFICGPNTNYGTGTELEIGGWTTGTTVSRIRNSNGNLHMDCKTGHNMYLNHYPAGNIFVGNGGGYLQSYQQVRSPIFYDLDNTGYYGNFASNSVFNTVTFNGGTLSGTLTMNTQKALVANNYGRGVYGLYSSTKFQHVWSMGTAYNLSDDGSTTGNLYGLCWSYPNAGGAAANLNTHGLMVINNGGWDASLASSTRAGSDMRAPIYYDLNDTGYYLDPASKSFLSTIHFNGSVSGTGAGSEIGRNHAYDTMELKGYGAELMIGAQNAGIHVNYRTCNGGVSGQTPITWWWRAGSSTSWSDHYFGKVGAAVDVRAPIFYDSANTAYYGDFASNSNINTLTSAGTVLIGGVFANNPYNSVTGARLMFGGQGNSNYYIGTNLESFGGNYTKLDIRWHTGIRMGAQPSYGGIRFYDTELLGTEIFAIGKSGNYVQAANSLRAPIFYDSNNTAFYLDASSTGTSLNVAGDVVGYSSSDIRYKDNVKPIENALDKIDKIKGYTFEWNEKSHKETGKKDIGVIAQEVEEILPEIVDTRDNGYKAVDYPKLTALLIQSVKEQQIIINDLKSRIEKLEL